MWIFAIICFVIVSWPSYHCGYKNGTKDEQDKQLGIPKDRRRLW